MCTCMCVGEGTEGGRRRRGGEEGEGRRRGEEEGEGRRREKRKGGSRQGKRKGWFSGLCLRGGGTMKKPHLS